MHKGRGAISNPAGRFEQRPTERISDGWEPVRWSDAGWEDAIWEDAIWESESYGPAPTTELFPDATRNLIAHNNSTDVPFDQSINPYKGCEHGCVYCFARPTHAYLDLSPGLDFETKIFFKTNVEDRLSEALAKPGYVCKVIALGANTDPYQPAEKQLRITRRILEMLLDCRHPVSVVTKGALVERDLDVLGELARHELVTVMVSVTSLDVALKTRLEPRAAAPAARLALISKLRDAGVPVGVLVAPIIPGLNDDEIETIVAECAARGARSVRYVLLRLPHEIKDLFREWLEAHEPLKAGRVMSLIRSMRGGKDYDSRWRTRQTGEGVYAKLLARRFELALKKHGLSGIELPPLRTDLFRPPSGGQLPLL
jgi:DNA repair photolyase